MTVKEVIDKLNEYPQDMKVCLEKDIYNDIIFRVLDIGEYISDNVDLEEPYLSIC